jgi:hypothetical protein
MKEDGREGGREGRKQTSVTLHASESHQIKESCSHEV